MSFPCTQCGCCCRLTATMSDSQLASVGLVRGASGYCAEFDLSTARCRSYEKRPLACRIEQPTRYRLNAALCNHWMRAAGLTTFITETMLRKAGV